MLRRTLSSKKFGKDKLVIQLVQDCELEGYPRQDLVQVCYLQRDAGSAKGAVFVPVGTEYYRPHELRRAMDAFDARKQEDPEEPSQWCRPLREVIHGVPQKFDDDFARANRVVNSLPHEDAQCVLRVIKQLMDKLRATHNMGRVH